MIRIKAALILLIAPAATGLAFMYWQGDSYPAGLVSLAAGLAWIIGFSRGWRWPSGWCFIILAALTIYGAALEQSIWILLLVLTVFLLAWDLECFIHRIEGLERVDALKRQVSTLIRRLSLVGGIGLIVSGAAMLFRFKIGFVPLSLIGMTVIICLAYLVKTARLEKE